MAFVDHLFAVIPMLGILILVHELGHFLVAKACGVRVLKFSIGFGAPIGIGKFRMRWERAGTEYVVGWIPLGGFVRMLGEPMAGDEEFGTPIPDDVKEDEYLESHPVWQRLLIVFAGPAMNLFLPVICFLGVLWVGLPRADAVIGAIETNSPAAIAGLRAGDRIVSLDGDTTTWWEDVLDPIRESEAGDSVAVEVDREGDRETFDVVLASRRNLDRFGKIQDSGWIGLGHRRLAPLLGVPSDSSLAAIAGLRSGDLVLSIGDTSIEDWSMLEDAVVSEAAAARDRGDRAVTWQIERHSEKVFGSFGDDAKDEAKDAADEEAAAAKAERPAAETLRIDVAVASLMGGAMGRDLPTETTARSVAGAGLLARIGVAPAPILIHSVSPDSPAMRAGLESNDLVLAVDGDSIGSFESLASLIQTSEGRELVLTISRAGRVFETRLRAQEELVPGPLEIEGTEQKVYRVGVGNALSALPGSQSTDRVRNPVVAVPRAFKMTWRMTTEYLKGLGMLFTGEVGAEQLSGPIGIARIARQSLDRGWMEYIFMMMLISINLGILNLLPIPILDGGQALIYSVEGIKRSPVSMRTREVAAQLGFAVLVVLMGRAFWNDLTPFWSQFIQWVSESP